MNLREKGSASNARCAIAPQAQRASAPSGGPDGGEVDVDGVFDVARVAAGHGDRDRDAGVAAQLEHQPIALGQTALGDLQTSQAIALEGIGAGEKDDELRLRGRQRRAHAALDRGEIVSSRVPSGSSISRSLVSLSNG